MLENCDVIVIFRTFGQFGAVGGRTPDTESAKVMFSVTVTFCLTNYCLLTIALSKGPFLTKNVNILQINADVSKIKGT